MPGTAWPGEATPRAPAARRNSPPEERHEVLALARHPLAELAAARTHWALRPLAEAAYPWGYLRGRISKSTVGRWLSQVALHPHRIRRWLHGPDPDFRRKVRRLVRLYLRPPAPGQPERFEAHYRRHGTVAILAGLDARSGQGVVRVHRRRRHQECLERLKAIRARWPRGTLAIVLDNLSIPTTPEAEAWLRAQAGRVRLEFLPLHASWLNQIELWFSILERQALRRASDTSSRGRTDRIYRFTRQWNRLARPFRWTFKGYPLCR